MTVKDESIGVGRRKTAVASVRLRKGSGNIDINNKKIEEYFPLETHRMHVLAALSKAGAEGQYDVIIRVKGGGIEAQTIAARLGIARALVKRDEDLRKPLKDAGFLTRDPRKKERKKYGKAKARKSYQFSKR